MKRLIFSITALASLALCLYSCSVDETPPFLPEWQNRGEYLPKQHSPDEPFNYSNITKMKGDRFFVQQFIFGAEGTEILLSEDLGRTWNTSLSIPYTANNTFTTHGETHAWFIIAGDGELPQVHRTDNIGTTWEALDPVDSGLDPRFSPNASFFLNDKIGWASGSDSIASAYKTIYKTTDGGQTWKKKTNGLTQDRFSEFSAIKFRNKDVGFAGERDGIWRSTNAGDLWEKVYTGQEIYYADIVCTSDKSVYALGNLLSTDATVLLHSVDGGDNWTFLKLPAILDNTSANQLFFVNQAEGYLLTKDFLLRTKDGGLNWEVDFKVKGDDDGYFLNMAIIPGSGFHQKFMVGIGRYRYWYYGFPDEKP
ncbi:hypothetical protein FUAX_24210 [Fulvitalea axinellae]|uniref:Photosynthesis system II assembly factor Ycf48/Hcf136-like domain-containing protein n=1 Tax=Fulvitalea axinellae TaxID=1182444 RepID=A0AAU9CCY8_9BACT|nr:hypothetical protein FUAX_24210 [Fulvitalea axinellae]